MISPRQPLAPPAAPSSLSTVPGVGYPAYCAAAVLLPPHQLQHDVTGGLILVCERRRRQFPALPHTRVLYPPIHIPPTPHQPLTHQPPHQAPKLTSSSTMWQAASSSYVCSRAATLGWEDSWLRMATSLFRSSTSTRRRSCALSTVLTAYRSPVRTCTARRTTPNAPAAAQQQQQAFMAGEARGGGAASWPGPGDARARLRAGQLVGQERRLQGAALPTGCSPCKHMHPVTHAIHAAHPPCPSTSVSA